MKRTVQLLLIDGDGAGRIQAQLDNWTGVQLRKSAGRHDHVSGRIFSARC